MKKIIKQIFLKHGLEEVVSIKNIEIGFTNKVYLINDKFILKVCEDLENEEAFKREAFFYGFFKNKIPVPRISIYDNSKSTYAKIFMIYPKIEGDNLYSKWHLLNDKQQKGIISQLCEILKKINESPLNEFVKKFKINYPLNWHNKILKRIKTSLKEAEGKNLLSPDLAKAIKDFLDANHHVLVEQKIALVYWDAHFDNILVKDNKIVGILDFERTELSSIDFVLDIVKRMVDYPKKYMSEESEKFAKKEDYAQLLNWFREFYPDLFKFDDLDRRLDLYAIEHDLRDVIDWPNVREVKQMIAKTVGFRLIF